MSKIVFRGKTYNSVFDMPNDIREAYQIEKRHQPTAKSNPARPLTEFVEMSDEIREMYERALGNVEDRTSSSTSPNELPSTEDIYRQSAPDHMKNIPSDEIIYRESRPLSAPAHQAIEDDDGPRRLAVTLGVLVLLGGIAFFILQYMG